jgi:hypothetical protein
MWLNPSSLKAYKQKTQIDMFSKDLGEFFQILMIWFL